MSTRQVKVHAQGCTPSNLELFKNKDEVVFIQSGSDAPTTVHIDNHGLFGTNTCQVGANAADATVYKPQNPGNYVIGITTSAVKEAGQGTIQVLCLAPSTARSASDSGSIRVTR